MYFIAWLMLLTPLFITLSALVSAGALVCWLFGWKVLLAVTLFATAAVWSFGGYKGD